HLLNPFNLAKYTHLFSQPVIKKALRIAEGFILRDAVGYFLYFEGDEQAGALSYNSQQYRLVAFFNQFIHDIVEVSCIFYTLAGNAYNNIALPESLTIGVTSPADVCNHHTFGISGKL